MHNELTGDGPYATRKGASRPDRLWVSPELAAYFVSCQVQDLFADHSALSGFFNIPAEAEKYNWWPTPSKVPWHCVDLQSWHGAGLHFEPFQAQHRSSSDYYAALGKHYEDNLATHCCSEAFTGLPSSCRGRAQHFMPIERLQQLGCPRPSRTGEEQPRSSLMNRAVQKWFRQLRRFQSLIHNLRRDSDAPSAVAYRLELWASIKRAKGFAADFSSWWSIRPHKLQGSPFDFPEMLPPLALAEQLFEDFKHNYRAFEAWNLRQRQSTLKATMKENSKHAFATVKSNMASAPGRFVETKSAAVLDVDPNSRLVHVDAPLPDLQPAVWTLDDEPIRATRHADHLIEIHSEVPLLPGQEISQSHHVAELDQSLATLCSRSIAGTDHMLREDLMDLTTWIWSTCQRRTMRPWLAF